jgi:hypothetical protein
VKTIYALVEPDTRKIRYVGRTGDKLEHRARLHWVHRNRNDQPVRLWLRTLDVPPPIEILQEVEDHEWIEAERYWIHLLTQVPTVDLLNLNSRELKKIKGDSRKITDDQIMLIRNAQGTYRSIGHKLGVSHVTVFNIKHRIGRFAE